MERERRGYLSGRTRARDWLHMQRLLIGCAIAVIAVLAIWHPAPRPISSGAPTPSPFPSTRHRITSAHLDRLVVYVAGEVAHPGLYRLQTGARVDDAVRLAGGLLKSADPLSVNLAARLGDGDEVAVPAVGASRQYRTARHPARRSKAANAPVDPVDVNAADAPALARVPGIGAAIARRIVELREQEGAFSSLDELLDVAGMTPSRLDRASRYLIL